MKIDRINGEFLAKVKFEERNILRDAGWKWDRRRKRWITTDTELVRPFHKHTINAAREHLDNYTNVIEKSFAEEGTEGKVFPAPQGLAYKPFQNAGIEYALPRKDVLLADPPGLGKTIQAIGVANTVKSKKILIICPASLKKMWLKEWKRWCVQNLSVDIAKTRVRTKNKKRYTERYFPESDVVIINYELVEKMRDQIDAVEWDIMICDESHYMKNEDARRTQVVLGGGKRQKRMAPIYAARRLFLSGTPITKRPIDIWTMCKTCDPKNLGKNYHAFVYRYCGAFETHFNGYTQLDVTGATNLDELQHHMRGTFMVRRDKQSVLKELPDKTRKIVELPSEGLRRLIDLEYDVVSKHLALFEELVSGEKIRADGPVEIEDIPKLMEEKFGHLANLDFDQRAEHLTSGEEVAFEAISEVRRDLAIAMVPMVKQYVDELVYAGEKVILFCYHKDVALEYKEHYKDCAYITGSVPNHKRQAEVDKFQEDDTCRVFVGNISAAGVGHTLTAAYHVVFAELSWLPSEMEQAEDRAWRIGQDNAVLVHLLVAEGSLATRMLASLIATQSVINQALDRVPK